MSEKQETFCKEVAAVINRLSLENGSNTPDYLIAEYLWECLEAFNVTVYCREKWYGRQPQAAVPASPPPQTGDAEHKT